MNVIDLFCGCGGFSKGFHQAGFNIVYGIDNWKDATVTYKYNFPTAVISNEDITHIRGKDILEATGLTVNDIDVIIGDPLSGILSFRETYARGSTKSFVYIIC